MANPSKIPRHPLHWRSWRFRAVAGLVAFVLAVRLIWGWHVGRVLAAQLEEVRRRGEPAKVEDVVYEAVPEAENAYNVVVRAAKALSPGVNSPRSGTRTYREYPPYSPAWTTAAQASENANRPAFALARQARGLTRVQVRDRLVSPLANTLLPHFSQVRTLANTMCDSAALAQQNGEDYEALDRVMDTLHIAWVMRHDEFLISQLVATGIDALAQSQTQIMAPGLRLPKNSVARAKAGELIALLLKEDDLWKGIGRSIRLERVMVMDSLALESRGTWLIRPLAEMAVVRNGRNMDIAAQAAQLRDRPGVAAVLGRVAEDRFRDDWFLKGGKLTSAVPRYSRWFNDWGFYYGKTFDTEFRLVSDRRMTAVSLAAQIFRADHGRWPEKLEELVPEYLPAVPVDPCRADRGPLGYMVQKGVLPGNGDRPLVYSEFGLNDPAMIKNEPMYGFQQYFGNPTLTKWNGNSRQYRDLARFEPLPQAVDGDQTKPDGPGNQSQKNDPAKKPKAD